MAENLAALRRALPPEVFQKSDVIGLTYFLRDSVIYAGSFTLLVYGVPWYTVPALWALMALAAFGLYQIGHDCGHKSVFTRRWLNALIGQIAFLPSLHPMAQWVYGHNGLHHKHTSCLKRDLAWHPRSPDRYANMSFVERMLHRLYWSPMGAGPYYLFKMWFQGLMLYPAPIRGARRDIALTVSAAVGTIALVVFIQHSRGATWAATGTSVFVSLIVPFLLVNYLTGFTVYLHHIDPDLAWKKESDWTPEFGELEATTNYIIPAWFNFFAHNIFIHVPHHLHPGIPFYRLTHAAEALASAGRTTFRRGLIGAYFRAASNCKLFDASTGRWVTYRDAGAPARMS